MNDAQITKIAQEAADEHYSSFNVPLKWSRVGWRRKLAPIIESACKKAAHSYEQAATDNADWFDQLVHDCSVLLECEEEPTAIIGKIKYQNEERIRFAAHESERKTVHQWLNECAIPKEENGKAICLLRRLRIVCDKLAATSPATASEQDNRTYISSHLYDINPETDFDAEGNLIRKPDSASTGKDLETICRYMAEGALSIDAPDEEWIKEATEFFKRILAAHPSGGGEKWRQERVGKDANEQPNR